MFKHLIIPLDGSRLAEAVLPTAVNLARRLNASVTLVHVIERNPPKQIHGEMHLALPAEADNYLKDVRERYFPPEIAVDWHVHTVAIADVAESIVDHAHEFGSDLVVMCTHGKGGLKQWLFGSIAQQVSATRIPVLLVRPEPGGVAPTPNGGPFLVPLDGTETREAALPFAAALAKACGTGLRLLMVVPTPGTLAGAETSSRILLPATTKAMLDLASEDAVHYLKRIASQLQAETGVPVSGLVTQGEGGKLIAHEALNSKADWIIMGTSAKTGMDAFWSGSVAPQVSNRIYRPLLLIPWAE
jgi:nucleotide-binding universal stress UspA family protein